MRVTSASLLALAAATLALAGCQKKAEDGAFDGSADSAAGEVAAPPKIGGDLAPGVAFTYSYDFTLPAKAISGVQRQHLAACRQLGTARCRVTDMDYQQHDDDVSARIDFLLAPDLAPDFAGDAAGVVEAAAGKVDRAAASGSNAGKTIALSQQDSAAKAEEIKRIEARLAAKGLSASERAELTRELAELHGTLDQATGERRELEQAIATTPVTFAYSSEGVLSGKGSGFAKAAAASWSSTQSLLGFVALVAGLALPWVGLIAITVFAWRWLRRRRLAFASQPAAPVA